MRIRIHCLGVLLGFVPLCTAFAADVSTAAPIAIVQPAQLDAFMEKWKTYKSSPGPTNDATSASLLLAALKKDPKGPWANYLLRSAAATHAIAARSNAEARTNLFRQTFEYLSPARAILADALVRDEKLQHTYDQVLGIMAKAALEAGSELGEVKGAAQEMLANNIDLKSWNYGNVIYDANTLFGRVALREANIDDAKKYLLAAGKTKGSPQLNSFGPNFTLARELAEKGERDTVIEFLDLVGAFWTNPGARKDENSRLVASHNREQLDSWKEQIRDGKIPTDHQWR